MCIGEACGAEECALAAVTWPCEIIPSRVYLGTTSNSENVQQLEQGPVLICSPNGISRGPALAIAQVMSMKRLPHLSALAYVMKRKRDISPHAGAYTQLQELEQEIQIT